MEAVTNILQGDALTMLRTLPSDSVQCCVTSPPYFGLRDYGIDGQLGLESTPAEYIARMVEVFEEVRRVLRPDGTLWLNIGDSYNGSGGAGGDYAAGGLKEGQPKYPGRRIDNLKPKDLLGIPWRLAFALQDAGADVAACRAIGRAIKQISDAYDDEPPDRVLAVLEALEREYAEAKRGSWWLRSDIIWAKGNPMPESVTDRPTKSHEYIFLLTKSARYFYDALAVAEPAQESTLERGKYGWNGKVQIDADGKERRAQPDPTDKMGDRWCAPQRNRRDVWNINTEPYPEAHFATFPTEIPRLCILAGTSAHGACPICGKPWVREVERGEPSKVRGAGASVIEGAYNGAVGSTSVLRTGMIAPALDLGFRPSCNHDAEPVPCVVLDPFLGSGTTGAVARELGRSFIGIELNPEYVKLAEKRIGAAQPPLFGIGGT